MRKYVTAAATAFTLGFLGLAAPAMADQYQPQGNPGQHGQYQGSNQGNYQQGYQGNGREGGYGAHDDSARPGGRDADWGRYQGNVDGWERGWGRGGWDNDRRVGALSYSKLVRRVEQQGYYGVRGLQASRFGGFRAFAYNFRGRPVMLRINPFNGRVLEVRYV